MIWRRRIFNENISGGRDIHPTGTGNLRGAQVKNTPYVYCVQCGHPNDTRKTSWGEGEGLEFTLEGTIENPYSVREVSSGCGFCGSRNWSWTKPRRLEDISLPHERKKRTVMGKYGNRFAWKW